MTKRKFSIVIPTRSRARYLECAINTSLKSAKHALVDVEIIVADNASDDGTVELMSKDWPSCVKWMRSDTRLSMRANFERALDTASGSHVLFIGDDDAVSVSGLKLLDHVLEITKAEVVQWPQINYSWPDTGIGRMKIRYADITGLYFDLQPEELILKFRTGKFHDYHIGANVYHGCVSMDLISRIKERDSLPYFHSAVPDVYAAILNLFFIKGRMIRLNYPVTIGGASVRSNGYSGQTLREASIGSEFSRFIDEAKGDLVGTGLPSTCKSINLWTLDSFISICRRFGFDGLVDSKAWSERISSDFLSFSDAPDLEIYISHAQRLLGDNRFGVDLSNVRSVKNLGIRHGGNTQGQLLVKKSFTSISVQGGPNMLDVGQAADFLERVSNLGRVSEVTPSLLMICWSLLSMIWRSRRELF